VTESVREVPPPVVRDLRRAREREREREREQDERYGRLIDRHLPALKYTNSLGITSLILGVVSLPFICMPCVGWIGVAIGSVGMLLGIGGAIQSMTRRGYGIGFPIGGITVCFLSVGLSVLTMTALAHMFDGLTGKNAAVAPRETAADPEPGAGAAPVIRPDGMPTVGNSARSGDVRVTLLAVRFGRVRYGLRFRDDMHDSDEDMLWARVRVENLSATKIVNYSTWREAGLFRNNTALKDEHGNSYAAAGWGEFRVDGGTNFAELYPGKSAEDVLVFKRPVDAARNFTLSLDGGKVGATDTLFRFAFTADQIDGWSKKRGPQK
jgi:hypothetical protein